VSASDQIDDDEPDELPSALRASRPEVRAESQTPDPLASDESAGARPKKQTLKLFPFSGAMGEAPPPELELGAPRAVKPSPHAAASADGAQGTSGRRDAAARSAAPRRGDDRLDPAVRAGRETPLVTTAVGKSQRATPTASSDRPEGRLRGPTPKDPAVVLAALEPHLAWLAEDLRPALFKQILCGQYEPAVASLQEHRQRYPRNLTIAKAVEVAEDAATSKLLHEIGPTSCEVIVVGSEARNPLSPSFAAVLRLARQAATLGELLEKSPVGRFRTLQLVTQLVQDGMLAIRSPTRAAGFGMSPLSTPSFEAVARKGYGAGVHEARTPSPPRVDPRADDQGDLPAPARESSEVMDRATLPDPGEVAVHLERLRQTRIDSPVPSQPPVSSQPPSSSQPKLLALLDRLEGEAAAGAPAPESSTPVASPPVGAEVEPTVMDDAAKHRAPLEADEPSPRARSMEPESATDRREPRDSVPPRHSSAPPPDDEQPPSKRRAQETTPELAAELKRLRPREIREADREGGLRIPTVVVGLAALAVLVSGVSLYVTLGAKPERASNPPAPDPRPLPTLSPPTGTPSHSSAPTPPSSAPAGSSDPSDIESVTLEVEVSPPYAQIYLDGTLLTKPFKVALARDSRDRELRIEAGGYKTQKRTFTMKGDRSFVIALEPMVGKKRGGDSPPSPTYD
jgi:hypothetical protein